MLNNNAIQIYYFIKIPFLFSRYIMHYMPIRINPVNNNPLPTLGFGQNTFIFDLAPGYYFQVIFILVGYPLKFRAKNLLNLRAKFEEGTFMLRNVTGICFIFLFFILALLSDAGTIFTELLLNTLYFSNPYNTVWPPG